MIIEEYEKKGYRISVYPRFDGEWYWCAGVYIGNDTKAKWINSDNECPFACYKTYSDALNAVIDYCGEKGKRKKHT